MFIQYYNVIPTSNKNKYLKKNWIWLGNRLKYYRKTSKINTNKIILKSQWNYISIKIIHKMMFQYIIGTKNNSLNYVQKIILDLQMLKYNTHKSIKCYNTILKQGIA